MAYKVQLLPSNKTFTVEGRETILRAGMRDGLNLSHSCMNGSCGECRARLVDGTIRRSRHHDFPISEHEFQQGWFLACCNQAQTDLIVEMHEMSHPGELPLQQIDAKVSGLQQLQDDVMHLQLRLPRSQVMDFLAGQRAQLCLEDGSCLELGIASCPCDSHSLSFHVRRQPDDAFSNRVFEHLQKGKKVALSGPVGRFTLDEASSRPLIFIAWESGFAQIKSIIDHVVSIDPERQMFLHWLSALPQGHYLSNYCRSWRDALDNFNYQCVDLQPLGEATFVSTLQGIAAQHENLEEFDIYAVLPEYEADIMLSFMVENEVMESRLFTEILKQS